MSTFALLFAFLGFSGCGDGFAASLLTETVGCSIGAGGIASTAGIGGERLSGFEMRAPPDVLAITRGPPAPVSPAVRLEATAAWTGGESSVLARFVGRFGDTVGSFLFFSLPFVGAAIAGAADAEVAAVEVLSFAELPLDCGEVVVEPD